jgi:spore coat polysaccharide biosynthesis protein SpsF
MIAAVIQARTGSTRLPGKVLRTLGDKPVLAWVVRAAKAAGVFDDVVVATTTESGDDAVVELADSLRVHSVRGSVTDVLSRYIQAVDEVRANVVVRLTADCPLLDPAVIAACVRAFDVGALDYLSTGLPHTLAHGFDVEVFSAGALRTANVFAEGVDRVHVTSYLYSHPEAFRLAGLTFTPECTDLRVTLDEPDDAALLDALVAEIGDGPHDWRKVVAVLRARPDLVAINAHVRQKALADG